MLRIGLDIDDVLGDFMGSYYTQFECNKYPNRMQEQTITRNVQRKLRIDRNFWVNLPVLNIPDFEPVLYCTKRVNRKAWTKAWLEANGFPNKPVYQLFTQSGNKADRIKGKVDVFIDDSVNNVIQMNASGVPALLFRKYVPGLVSVYTLHEDEIRHAYNTLQRMKWKSR